MVVCGTICNVSASAGRTRRLRPPTLSSLPLSEKPPNEETKRKVSTRRRPPDSAQFMSPTSKWSTFAVVLLALLAVAAAYTPYISNNGWYRAGTQIYDAVCVGSNQGPQVVGDCVAACDNDPSTSEKLAPRERFSVSARSPWCNLALTLVFVQSAQSCLWFSVFPPLISAAPRRHFLCPPQQSFVVEYWLTRLAQIVAPFSIA